MLDHIVPYALIGLWASLSYLGLRGCTWAAGMDEE